jgi:high-affinity K+ transport system ATPase subunit B
MTWLKTLLIGLGIVVVLVIAIVLLVSHWGGGSGSPVNQTISLTVGTRTVTVGGHYKEMTQESMADGMNIVVDGHEITINADQLTIDGKTQVLEPGQDVDISVNEKGAVEVKVVHTDTGVPGKASP